MNFFKARLIFEVELGIYSNYTTWHSSDFYSTDRRHQYTSLKKNPKNRKKIFVLEMGSPIKYSFVCSNILEIEPDGILYF